MTVTSSANQLLIDNYLDSIWMEKGLSRNSLESYGRDLSNFAKWLDPQGIRLLAVVRQNLQIFLSHRFEQGLSARTTARQLSCLRGFFATSYEKKRYK